MIRTRARGRTSGNSWFKSASYLLNNVAPALIHDYAKNRYYNTTDGVISFPVTTTRTTNAMQFDANGNLVWADANMIPFSESFTGGTPAWVLANGGTGLLPVRVGTSTDVPSAMPFTQSVRFTLDKGAGTTTTDLSEVYNPAPPTSGAIAARSVWAKSFDGNTYTVIMGGGSPVTVTPSWQEFKITAGSTERFRIMIRGAQTPACSDTADILVTGAKVWLTGTYTNGLTEPRYISTASAYFGPRLDYNPATLQPRGYLIEAQRTNSIRNNTGQGGVAGSPGTAPTNWSISTIPGVTITTSYGIENGIPYIEVSYSGTNTSGVVAYPTISPEQTNNVAAASGQTWTHSAFAKKVSGADSESQWNVGVVGRDSGGALVSGESVTTDFVGGARLSDSRVQASRTFVNAAVAFAQPRITRDSLGIGETMDITIRIGLPQLEQGAFATSAIPTYGVAATRSGDIANLITPPPYSATGTTYYAEFERQGTPVNSSSEAQSGVWFFGTSGGTQVSAPFGYGAANQIRVDLYESGTQQCGLSDSATPFTVHKLCARVAPNDARAAYDTVLTAQDTTVVMPVSIPTTVQAIGRRESATHQMHGWLKDFRIYETAAPDASLQAITA